MTRRQLYLTSFTMSLSVVSYPFFYPVTTGAMKMGLFFFIFLSSFLSSFFISFLSPPFVICLFFYPGLKKTILPPSVPTSSSHLLSVRFFYPVRQRSTISLSFVLTPSSLLSAIRFLPLASKKVHLLLTLKSVFNQKNSPAASRHGGSDHDHIVI